MKQHKYSVLSFFLILAFIVFNAHASSLHLQRCKIGEKCPIPGDDFLDTQFVVKPVDGTLFSCEVNASSPKLTFWLTGSKGFKVTRGEDLYTAAPKVIITVRGIYSNPNDPNSEGMIVIHRLEGEGEVTCYQ